MNRPARVALVVLALAAVLFAADCERLFLHKGYPQTDGQIDGLAVSAEVQVLRDEFGFPHIYAESRDDLMFGLGFVHAQDRLWQMETLRCLASGRLSAVAGPETIEIDHLARLVDLPRLREKLAARLTDAEREAATAYLAGINAVVARRQDDPPLEFDSLGITPEPWTVEDLYSVAVANAWFLQTNLPQEILALAARKNVDFDGLADLLPSYPDATLPDDRYFDSLRAAKTGPILPAMESLYSALPSNARGSNNWVVRNGPGGKPLYAGDPHLELVVPPVWYFCELATEGFRVAGASMPGIPGVILGHNDHIAWSFTNVMADIVDLYVLRLDPEMPGNYLVGDRSLPFEFEVHRIKVAGADDVSVTIRRTIHGPVITAGSEDADAVVALKWLGTMPVDELGDQSGLGLEELNRARSVDEAIAAGRRFKLQAQNLVVADTDGNIGFHAFGGVPVRTGYTGRLPADGSSGTMDWTGLVPYDALPSEINPERGFIATANNRTTTGDSPYPLTYGWCPPYRVERISQLLSELDSPTADDFRRIQLDVHSLQADRILPKVAALPIADAKAKKALALLADWDREVATDSVGAAVWNVFWVEFARATVGDELGDSVRWVDRLLAAAYLAPEVLLDRPNSPLWDDVTTPDKKETPVEITTRALAAAIDWLEAHHGTDPAGWTWGTIHRYFWAHPGARKPIEHRLLSRGPYPAPGDNTTVDIGMYIPGPGDHWDAALIPSFRMVVPLAHPETATIIGPMGQSGQPGHPHYDDLTQRYIANDPAPLYYSFPDVNAHAKQKLVLAP